MNAQREPYGAEQSVAVAGLADRRAGLPAGVYRDGAAVGTVGAPVGGGGTRTVYWLAAVIDISLPARRRDSGDTDAASDHDADPRASNPDRDAAVHPDADHRHLLDRDPAGHGLRATVESTADRDSDLAVPGAGRPAVPMERGRGEVAHADRREPLNVGRPRLPREQQQENLESLAPSPRLPEEA
jgi:hypothetical protein